MVKISKTTKEKPIDSPMDLDVENDYLDDDLSNDVFEDDESQHDDEDNEEISDETNDQLDGKRGKRSTKKSSHKTKYKPVKRLDLKHQQIETNANGSILFSKWPILFVIFIAILYGSFLNSFKGDGVSSPISFSIGESKWQRLRQVFSEKKLNEKYKYSVASLSLRLMQQSLENSIHLAEKLSNKLEPSVMFVMSVKGNRNSSCLLHDIRGILESVLNSVNLIEIDGSTSSFEEVYNLEDKFVEDSIQYVVIKSVDKMLPQAFLQLHKYANHQDSVKNKLVLVLTAESDKVNNLNHDSSLKELEELSTHILEEAYLKGQRENFEKMNSRLTSHPIAVLSSSKQNHFVCK